ncbi:MAG: 4-(cytidine 5'-diphospho)-2-C-methyl-D-erythritol kinase [Clostridiales bacterium]|nr:4-(cytidine 5'-diphospho)-2-C-methyl-D-erythritol kinase [Clostridiales bacterium]
METVIWARAKINLNLYVLGKRDNGYHDLELIFQPVSLADELMVKENGKDGLDFSCSVPEFSNPNNLVCRGYETLRQQFPDKVKGLEIYLKKNIPSGAGMAGGSTDCSALLLWMNRHFSLGLSRNQLVEIGVKLGADVPACMVPHATLGRGVGEILTDIPIFHSYPILLLKPEAAFPTGQMFRFLDQKGISNRRRKTEALIRSMEAGDLSAMCSCLHNDFEEAVPERELIGKMKQLLLEAGALGSLMTGSGSVVYGIFDQAETRDRAAEKLREICDFQVYTCEAVNEWEET